MNTNAALKSLVILKGKQKLPINRLLKKLIEDRKIQNFKIEPEYNEVLASFKQRLNKMKSIHDDPENFIYDKFAELRRRVDLDKEKAIQKIEKLSNDLINKLNSVEDELKIECKSNRTSLLLKLLAILKGKQK